MHLNHEHAQPHAAPQQCRPLSAEHFQNRDLEKVLQDLHQLEYNKQCHHCIQVAPVALIWFAHTSERGHGTRNLNKSHEVSLSCTIIGK